MRESFFVLAEWFAKEARILPWRENPTPYAIWVSEIMLQQTQVATVVPYFKRFMARFPSVESLGLAPLEEVLVFWAGLGYYSRARNLHAGASLTVEQKHSPQNRKEWLEIPGVGPYTAGAICSIALEQPEAILDANVDRVLSRFYRIGEVPGRLNTLWRFAEALVKEAHAQGISPRVFNQALMELGALVCVPVEPRCLLCPLRGECGAFAKGETAFYPPAKKRAKIVSIEEQLHCVFDAEGRVLLRRREEGEWRGGLWDFLEEDPRELLGTQGLGKLGSVFTSHVITHHKIKRSTHVWCLHDEKGDIKKRLGKNYQWFSLAHPIAVGSAFKKTLSEVLKLTASQPESPKV